MAFKFYAVSVQCKLDARQENSKNTKKYKEQNENTKTIRKSNKSIMKFCIYMWSMLLLAVTQAIPMTNDDEPLVSLDSVEEQPPARELPHMVIAAKKPIEVEPTEERPGLFDTIVQELRAAGVQTSEKRELQTLSYRELTRLLALWHLASGRNFYEANENRAPPPPAPWKQLTTITIDNDNKPDKWAVVVKHT